MDLAAALSKTLEDATPRSKSIFGGAKAMSIDDVTEFITEYPVALISTVGADGSPHTTGKAAVLLDGKLYIGSYEDSALGRNLRRNQNVAIAFAEPPWKRHIFIYGTARYLEDGSQEELDVRAAHRSTHGYESSGMFEVLPRKVFTWKD